MRTRAINDQVCMVVARNNVTGSCIIDRKGGILAWNNGDREVITATLPADDGYGRTINILRRYWAMKIHWAALLLLATISRNDPACAQTVSKVGEGEAASTTNERKPLSQSPFSDYRLPV